MSAQAGAPEISVLPAARPAAESSADPTPPAQPGLALIRPPSRPEILLEEGDRSDPEAEIEVSMGNVPPVAATAGLVMSPLPVARPRVVFRTPPPAASAASAPAPEVLTPAVAPAPVRVAPPPQERPRGLLAAIFRAPDKPSSYPREGSVCGDPAIRGVALPPIPARLAGCGLQDPVRITAVDGVALSTPAVLSCDTARALRGWVTGAVKPTVGRAGGGLAALKVAASYSCRTRNNIPGAKVSEHGRGKAIDISAFILKDGTVMTVLKGWRDRVQGPILQTIHANACGTFGTVLGPRSDKYHRDHFHLDTATQRNGPYCR